MRVKFQDVECFRDSQYEYEESLMDKDFNLWQPPVFEKEEEKEEEQSMTVHKIPEEIDMYTELFAEELGLRSLKNQSGSIDDEKLDLSWLDYDVIDIHARDTNVTLHFTEKKKSEVSVSKANSLNEKFLPHWKEVDGQNVTTANFFSKSSDKNTTQLKNSSKLLFFNDSYSANISLKNDTKNTNDTNNTLVSGLDNTAGNVNIVNVTGLLTVGNISAEIMGLNSSLQNNSSSRPEIQRNFTTDNQTAVDSILANHFTNRLTRGDVFFHPVYPSNLSNNFYSAPKSNGTVLLQTTAYRIENDTARNVTISELQVEIANKTSENCSVTTTAAITENGPKPNSSQTVTFPVSSTPEKVVHIALETDPLNNVTMNTSTSNLSGEISLQSRESTTVIHGKLNHSTSAKKFSNETAVSANLSSTVRKSSPEELSALGSSEEVFIFLKENNTNLIKTTSIKTQDHNWTYDGTHQMESMEIPDYMLKYFGQETPQTTPAPQKMKKVNIRQWPQKGHGMKTKKRKEYKPQVRSGVPFSPRGFNPGMTPRGARPIMQPQPFSNEEELNNHAVVIGVPRPDFSDYELYVPGDEPQHLFLDEQDVKADEYEYVMYKDPYSSHEDIKNFNLDETTKYHLKYSGTKVKTYFIAAEEVDWDYAGYGQR